MAKRARTKRIPTMGGDGEGYLAGQILIATPSMQDPQFAGSIICVCAHSEEGAMGLVLNRPMEGLSFDDLLKQLDLEPVPAQRSIRLHQGGPQEGGRGFVLHTNDWSSEGFGEAHDAKWRQAFAKLRVDPLLLSAAAGHA